MNAARQETARKQWLWITAISLLFAFSCSLYHALATHREIRQAVSGISMETALNLFFAGLTYFWGYRRRGVIWLSFCVALYGIGTLLIVCFGIPYLFLVRPALVATLLAFFVVPTLKLLADVRLLMSNIHYRRQRGSRASE